MLYKLYIFLDKNKNRKAVTVSIVGGNNGVVMEWFAAMGTTVRWLKTNE